MTRKQFLESLNGVKKDEEISRRLSSIYEMEIPEIITKILTQYSIPVLFDENESRTLSLNEVIHAEEDLGVSLRNLKILPIADFGEGDYLVYDGNGFDWHMYNFSENISFDRTISFDDIFLR